MRGRFAILWGTRTVPLVEGNTLKDRVEWLLIFQGSEDSSLMKDIRSFKKRYEHSG